MRITSCPSCGCDIETRGKPRSVDQHRRFFKIIRHAFEQWPEAHEFQPEDATHLRKWLTCKAGPSYREAHMIDIKRVDPRSLAMATAAVAAAMRALGQRCWVVPHDGALAVVAAKSIRFDKLPHLAFCALNDAVSEVIEAETGIAIKDLLPAMEDAA
jgi:hypothetical protein